ncbi:MAG: DUF443 family protein [Streptococcus sp.]|nr:DUF443 family protein [Streptococcus sp.]
MQTVQLVHISIRYMVFTANNHYYLLDRRPVNILGYFFPYINWLFKQKIYPISKQEFDQLVYQEQHKSGFTLSRSAIIWSGVGVSSFVTRSKLVERFTTSLSTSTISLILCFLFIVAFFLAIKIHDNSKSNMNSQINLDSKEFHYYKLRLQKITFASVKFFFIYIFWLFGVFIGIFLSVEGKSAFSMFLAFVLFLVTFMAGVVAYQPDIPYSFYPDYDENR